MKTDSLDPEHPIKVAIVEAEEMVRRTIIQALKDFGEFVCVGAYRSANEALAEIPKVRPHVVLLDIGMSDMSGLACARQLKNLLPGLVVIFVIDVVDDPTIEQAVRAGADDFLVKPVVAAPCVATTYFAVGRSRR
jgi:DNA-binding NarL/FixJ family response regulator